MERLAEDHRRAKEISEVLEASSFVNKVEPTETNIILFNLAATVSEEKFKNDLEEKGIRISDLGPGKLRIVTHLDYTEEMHRYFLDFLRNYA